MRFHVYHFDAAADFDGAVRIYRRCRQAGITARGLIDCMIAAVAWREPAAILARDVDLDRVARVVGSTWTSHHRLNSRAGSGQTLTGVDQDEHFAFLVYQVSHRT